MVPICSEWWLLHGFSFQPFSYSGCSSHHYFMLQLTLIIFFSDIHSVCFIPFVCFQKNLRLLSLLFLSSPSLTPFTWCSLFCHIKQNLVFLSRVFYSFPTVPFLISCKDFVSYLCSVHEDLIAYYFFQTSFNAFFHIVLSCVDFLWGAICTLWSSLNYLSKLWWQQLPLNGLLYIDTNACYTELPLSHLCFTLSPPLFYVCLLSLVLCWNYSEIIRPLGHELLFLCSIADTIQVLIQSTT